MWYRDGITGSSLPTTVFDPSVHGDALVEYAEVPENGEKFLLTSDGYVFRSRHKGAPWVRFYEIMQWSVPAHVAAIRKAQQMGHQRIIADNYAGPVREPAPVRVVTPARASGDQPEERKERVEKTKDAAKKEPAAAAAKPQRLGARAKKLLEKELGLTRPQQEEVLAKADTLSRQRTLPNNKPDNMTRVWDVYEAAGKELPSNIAAEKEEFMKTGVLKRVGGGDGGGTPKAQRGGSSADSPAPSSETSKQQRSPRKDQPGNGGKPTGKDSDIKQEKATESPTSGSSNGENETL